MDQYYIYLKLAAETLKNTKKLVLTIARSKYGYNAFEAKAYALFIKALRRRQIYKYLQKRFPTGANTMTFL